MCTVVFKRDKFIVVLPSPPPKKNLVVSWFGDHFGLESDGVQLTKRYAEANRLLTIRCLIKVYNIDLEGLGLPWASSKESRICIMELDGIGGSYPQPNGNKSIFKNHVLINIVLLSSPETICKHPRSKKCGASSFEASNLQAVCGRCPKRFCWPVSLKRPMASLPGGSACTLVIPTPSQRLDLRK